MEATSTAIIDIVTGWNRESPLDFRVDLQLKAAARRLCGRMTTRAPGGAGQSNSGTQRRRRIPAQCAVVAALLCCGSSLVGVASAAWQRPAGQPTLIALVFGPVPRGEITPDPPAIPAPTANPLEPPAPPPPPRAQQPRPQQPPGPASQPPAGPAPQQQGPPPSAPAPPPPPPRPPGGHVQLSP